MAVGSFFTTGLGDPSKIFMRPTWDNERLTSFNFTSLKQKKVRHSRIRQIERLADCLDAFDAIKSRGMRRQRSPLKIGWDVARTFLKEATSTVSPPDLLYSGGDGNHNIGDLFRHFGIFSSLTAMMIKFV
jgi:hypothetical protein